MPHDFDLKSKRKEKKRKKMTLLLFLPEQLVHVAQFASAKRLFAKKPFGIP